MADETVDLQFLARQGRQILDEMRDSRAEMDIIRTDNRRVLGELTSNRAAMAGLATEMTNIRGEIDIVRGEISRVHRIAGRADLVADAILVEMREMRAQNASFDNRLRRLEETSI